MGSGVEAVPATSGAPGASPLGPEVALGADGVLSNLAPFVVLNPSLAPLAEVLPLQRALVAAVERSVREILAPVVERSATIACVTARELVTRDLASEPDEAALRGAAHLMSSSLAGSLALVTCKEPMRASLVNQLKMLIQPPPGSPVEPQALTAAINEMAADNVELGCAVVERAAAERASRDVEENLQSAIQARRRHRASGAPGPFLDVSPWAGGRFPAALPEVLRPKAGGSTAAVRRVYEGFAVLPRPGVAGVAGGSPSGAGAAATGSAGAAVGSAAAGAGAGPPPVVPPPGAVQAGGAEGTSASSDAVADQMLAMELQGGLLEKLESALARLATAAEKEPALALHELPEGHEARRAIAAAAEAVSLAPRPEEAAAAAARRVLRCLYERPASRLHIMGHLALLDRLRDVCAPGRIAAEATRWLCSSDDERRLHRDASEGLVRGRLLLLPELDAHLSRLMSAGGRLQASAMELAAHILRHCVIVEPVASAADLPLTLEVLSKLASRPGAPEPLVALVAEAHSRAKAAAAAAAAAAAGAGAAAPPSKDAGAASVPPDAATAPPPPPPPSRPRDPPAVREQVAGLLDEWSRVRDQGDVAQMQYVVQLQRAGLLKCDAATSRLLRIMAELASLHHTRGESVAASGPAPNGASPPAASFAAVDAFAKLTVLLVKTVGDPSQGGGGTTVGRLACLSRVWNAIGLACAREAEDRPAVFTGKSYMRMYAIWLRELACPDQVLDLSRHEVQALFAQTLLRLNPRQVPGFAYCWLELVSNRTLLPRLLGSPNREGWVLLEQLLCAGLRFLSPHLLRRPLRLRDSVRTLYRGCLRVLLVLLHDFPEFLCGHHAALCDAIPTGCVQMRNLVLSAFPRSMRLPDPFTPNLKVDMLPEIAHAPKVLCDVENIVCRGDGRLKASVDSYLRSRTPASLPTELCRSFFLPPREAAAMQTQHDVPAMNALVLYVGMVGVRAGTGPQVAQSPAIELLRRIAAGLDPEGRYHLLNAAANQLRYPNSHTHYFSCALLSLFLEPGGVESLPEQITRVLLERLIVNRPHPWGLLVTFIELIKNPVYGFWNQAFTRCAPEIERLFESVARSCAGAGAAVGGVGEPLQQARAR